MFQKRFAGAVPFGLCLFVAAFPLLFWNEGRAVKTSRALAEGSRSVMAAEASNLDSQHDKKLVHVSGQADTQQILQDPTMGIRHKALKLKRNVEMYQWKQIGAGEDSSSNYDYRKAWSDTLLDSGDYPISFQNPRSLPFASETFEAQEVSVGVYWLSSSLLNRLSTFEPLALSDADLAGLEAKLGLSGAQRHQDHIYLPYGQGSSQNPAIGDVRVRFEYIPASFVSVVAQQNGSRLEPYTARSGGTVAIIKAGNYSADELFDDAVKQNNALTSFLRVFGFGIMAGGIRLFFSPLTKLAGFVPLLGGLMRFGATVIAGVLAFALSLTTASVAWFSYRPLVAIPLVLIAVASFYLMRQAGKNRPVNNTPTVQ